MQSSRYINGLDLYKKKFSQTTANNNGIEKQNLIDKLKGKNEQKAILLLQEISSLIDEAIKNKKEIKIGIMFSANQTQARYTKEAEEYKKNKKANIPIYRGEELQQNDQMNVMDLLKGTLTDEQKKRVHFFPITTRLTNHDSESHVSKLLEETKALIIEDSKEVKNFLAEAPNTVVIDWLNTEDFNDFASDGKTAKKILVPIANYCQNLSDGLSKNLTAPQVTSTLTAADNKTERAIPFITASSFQAINETIKKFSTDKKLNWQVESDDKKFQIVDKAVHSSDKNYVKFVVEPYQMYTHQKNNSEVMEAMLISFKATQQSKGNGIKPRLPKVTAPEELHTLWQQAFEKVYPELKGQKWDLQKPTPTLPPSSNNEGDEALKVNLIYGSRPGR